MFRFLPGIIIIQILTAFMVIVLSGNVKTTWDWLQVLLPIGGIGLLASFWFGSIAINLNKDKMTDLQNEFIKEREKIRVNAERSKVRMLKQNHKQFSEEARNVTAKANFKVGAVATGAAGVGLLLMTTQLITMGIMIVMTTGGVITGYALRARQEKTGNLPFSNLKLFPKKQGDVLEAPVKKIPAKKKK